jgi:hypothetical protein
VVALLLPCACRLPPAGPGNFPSTASAGCSPPGARISCNAVFVLWRRFGTDGRNHCLVPKAPHMGLPRRSAALCVFICLSRGLGGAITSKERPKPPVDCEPAANNGIKPLTKANEASRK